MTSQTLFGIIDLAVHLSSYYVDQKDLASYLGVSEGKLLHGLGLQEASVCGINEDAVSLGLNAVQKLLERHKLNPGDIGRLEVGTESNWDGSKSLKTYLMDLFEENTNVCGCDTTNACYGGTNALFNAMCWLESSFYDGRYAIVVCTDTAMYKEKALIPLSGSAACAILLGPDPVLKFDSKMVRHHFSNTFDFYKPRTCYPYPVVDGKGSLAVYSSHFREMYKALRLVTDSYDYAAFHTPYPRLPEKSCEALGIPLEKVRPSLVWARKVGNPYTASLYVSLASLLVNEKIAPGSRILMYSFGSGSSSSLFVLEKLREGMNEDFYNVFKNRTKVCASEFVSLLDEDMRKERRSDESGVAWSGYYLVKEENGIRTYGFLEKQPLQL